MDQPHPFNVLQEIGLPEKAATIYLSLLGSRRMTVAQIARDSGIKRPTCYEYLDLLLLRGFVVRVPVGKRIFYSPVDPKKILAEFKKKAALLEKSVMEMSQMRDSAVNKPRVIFYEGRREIRDIYEDLFKTVGDVHSIFPPAAFFDNFTREDYDEFDKSLGQHAFASKDLIVADGHYKEIKEIRDKNGSANKFDKKLPPWFTCNVDVLIYAEKVALISLRDLSGIVIENKDIADLSRNMHSFIWKSL